MEPFADTVRLWMLDLGFGVFDVIDRQKQLVIVLVRFATKLGALSVKMRNTGRP